MPRMRSLSRKGPANAYLTTSACDRMLAVVRRAWGSAPKAFGA